MIRAGWRWLATRESTQRWPWPRWAAPGLAMALTVVGQLLFVFLLPSQRGNDSTDFTTFYLPVAQNLAAGRGLTVDDGALAVRYPPLFPALLAGFFVGTEPLGLTEAAQIDLFRYLCLALIGLTFFRVAALELPPRWALAVCGLWAFYPPFLFIGKQPNSELPFLPLWLAMFEVAWRTRRAALAGSSRWATLGAWAFLAGLLAGGAALCRPIAFAVVLPLALALWLDRAWPWRRRGWVLALFTLGLLGPLLPWHLALAEARGQFTLMSTGGRLSMLDGLTFAAKVNEPPPMPAAALALARRIQDHRGELRTPSQVLRFLAAEPDRWAVAQLVVYKAARAWYATDSLRFEGLSLALQLPLLLLFLWAVWRLRQTRGAGLSSGWAWTCWTLSFVLYFWGMTVLVLSILRYLLPVLPLMLITVGLALREVWVQRALPSADPS